jgi:AraC-like DNA-binding protein
MGDVSYREHPPPPALVPWLACTWERRGEGSAPVRVLPDGCIDVIWTEGSGVALVGPNTTAFAATVPLGRRMVGARLRPGAAPALLGVVAPRLRDARPDIISVLGDDGRRLGAALEDGADPVADIRAWLTARGQRAAAPDPLILGAVARLDRPGPDGVRGVAVDLGLSERALRRRVTAGVGYGPKRLARVLRLWRALGAARAGEELASAAFLAGYVDQAHFSHDCRELAGVTPSALLVG